MMNKCFRCGRNIIELEGEYRNLRAYYLKPGDPALAEGAFGLVHATCLQGSKWINYWNEKVISHRKDMFGMQEVGEADGYTLLRDEARNTDAVISNAGPFFEIKKESLKHREPFGQGFILPCSSEFNLDFDEIDNAKRVQKALIDDGEFPLIDIFRLVGIDDTLVYPEVTKQGVLRYDRSMKRNLVNCWIAGQLDYYLYLPAGIVELLAR